MRSAVRAPDPPLLYSHDLSALRAANTELDRRMQADCLGVHEQFAPLSNWTIRVRYDPRRVARQDADFVVQLQGRSVDEVFAPLASQFKVDPQTSFETVTGTIKHVLWTPDHALVIGLFELSQDEHDQSRFGRPVVVRAMRGDAYVPAPEDVIITKLLWYQRERRSKGLNDARNILATQQKLLDAACRERWCRTHGTLELLPQLREQFPPLA